MPITVQNNAGNISGANAYVDSSFVDSYAADRNLSDSEWADLDQEQKDSAIIQATSHIDNKNISKFQGIKLNKGQSTQFPRSHLYDEDGYQVEGLPDKLKFATAEYAIRAAVSKLNPDITYDDRGLSVKKYRTKTDVIEEEFEYQEGRITPKLMREYPEADMLLKSYLHNVNFVMRF